MKQPSGGGVFMILDGRWVNLSDPADRRTNFPLKAVSGMKVINHEHKYGPTHHYDGDRYRLCECGDREWLDDNRIR